LQLYKVSVFYWVRLSSENSLYTRFVTWNLKGDTMNLFVTEEILCSIIRGSRELCQAPSKIDKLLVHVTGALLNLQRLGISSPLPRAFGPHHLHATDDSAAVYLHQLDEAAYTYLVF